MNDFITIDQQRPKKLEVNYLYKEEKKVAR